MLHQDGNKRSAAQTAPFFHRLNGFDVVYPLKPNGLAQIIEKCLKGEVEVDQLEDWYEINKIPIGT